MIVLTGPGSEQLGTLLFQKHQYIVSSYPATHPYHCFFVFKESPMSEGKIRLATVYQQQADVARQQGNIKEAIKHFESALDVYKEIAAEEPKCWRLVADVLEQIAATHKAAGELDKAGEVFAEAANLRKSLVQAEQREAAEEDEDD